MKLSWIRTFQCSTIPYIISLLFKKVHFVLRNVKTYMQLHMLFLPQEAKIKLYYFSMQFNWTGYRLHVEPLESRLELDILKTDGIVAMLQATVSSSYTISLIYSFTATEWLIIFIYNTKICFLPPNCTKKFQTKYRKSNWVTNEESSSRKDKYGFSVSNTFLLLLLGLSRHTQTTLYVSPTNFYLFFLKYFFNQFIFIVKKNKQINKTKK